MRKSPLALRDDDQTVFCVYVTNVKATEQRNLRASTVECGEILVSASEWKKVFSGIFVPFRGH